LRVIVKVPLLAQGRGRVAKMSVGSKTVGTKKRKKIAQKPDSIGYNFPKGCGSIGRCQQGEKC
jgi:hypothetical protein